MTAPNKGHFYVAQLANGRFVAASATAPYFCIRADDEDSVIAKVKSALAAYGEFRGIGRPRVEQGAPATSLTTLRAPKRVNFSEVCEHVAA